LEACDVDLRARRIKNAMQARKEELETDGHRALIVPTERAHEDGFVAHALTFTEMLQQSEAAGIDLDFIYHTIGTGAALPGMLAAKLMTGSRTRFRSIAICSYNDGVWSPHRRGSRQTHGILMIWWVAGLVAAGLAQGATAALPHASPWPTVATTASVCLLATLATRALASPKPAIGSTSRSRWT
jgi:hypothetical protein